MDRMSIIKYIVPFCCLLALAACESGKALPEWQKKYNKQEVRAHFADPPMFYAPHVFWFWDDTIKNESLSISMVREMARQRLNPGYAHPRSGFAPGVSSLPLEQYLAEPWFNSFGYALQEAINNGLTFSYCDDYNWPSGQAAGRVLEKYPELESLTLLPQRYCVKGSMEVVYDSVDFAVAAKLVDNHFIDASTLRIIGEGGYVTWHVPEGEWVVYTYKIVHHPGIDGGRVNCLDPRLMQVFIPMVHERYFERFSDEMGKHIPGVFVDNEGDYGWKMAWSEHLARRYQEKKGRDIRLWMPLLTEEDKKGLFVVARCDWFDVVSDVYNECYFTPLVNWLQERGMYYISNLWEESLQLQSAGVGDLMRTTRLVTMPGNDCLDMVSQDVHDFKEIQTVAELEGKPFMSEIMGVAGWVQTPEMMKMTVNSIISYGVSHIVPHGIYMNRELETVPFPADWYTENPYWEYLHYWTDFARRAAFVTRQSTLVADVLLLTPLESVWSFSKDYFCGGNELNAAWGERVEYINRVYSEAMRRMNHTNIDFLIGDKHYIEKSVVRLNSGRTELMINGHAFRAVVIPPSYVISNSVWEKICDFARQGGIVVVLGDLPVGSPEKGLHDEGIKTLSNELRNQPSLIDVASNADPVQAMIYVLQEKLDLQIRLKNAGRLYTAQRKLENADLYWFANNTDSTQHFTAWLRDASGNAEIWDCETGTQYPLVSVEDGGYRKVSLSLNPYEAYWVVFDTENAAVSRKTTGRLGLTGKEMDTKWRISYPDDSVVYKTTAKVMYTDEVVPDVAKLCLGYDDSSWKYFSRQEASANVGKLSYWRMNVPIGAKAVIFPPYWIGRTIWLNGVETRISDVRLALEPGMELLSFVVGPEDEEFTIAPFSFLVSATDDNKLASWYDYGLQQYSGYLDYEAEVMIDTLSPKMYIDLGEVKYMAEFFVNGKSVGARLWPPFRFEVSADYLKLGRNTFKIRIGNLVANELWIEDDMGRLREWNWAWKEDPDLSLYDAGLFGPITIE